MLPVCYSELGTVVKVVYFVGFFKNFLSRNSGQSRGQQKSKTSKVCNTLEASRTKIRSLNRI